MVRLAALLLLSFALSSRSPSQAATVRVVPSDTTVAIESVFSVHVAVDAIPDIKGYELIFSFDPARLELLGAVPGDVLTRSGDPYSFFVVLDVAPPDSAWIDGAMLAGSSSGPGILAFLRFKALALGDSPVQCRLVDVRDSNNARILPECVSGVVHVTGATLVRRPSWGTIKTLYH